MIRGVSAHAYKVVMVVALINVSGLFVHSFVADPAAMCDYTKVAEYMKANTSASDDHAVLCADSTPRTSFALLFQTCPGIDFNFHLWRKLRKVEGDCTTMIQGQALINYYKQYARAAGVFVECVNGTSIKVALQNCDPVHFLVVDNTTLYESYIYTVQW